MRRLPAHAARLRGRAAADRRRGRDRVLPGGHARRPSAGPTTSPWSRARSRRRTMPSASSEVRRAVARARHDRRLRHRGRHPGAAQLRGRRRLPARSSTRRRTTSRRWPRRPRSRRTCTVDFELQGCPIDKRQLLEVLSAFLNRREPRISAQSVCVECKRRGNVCVMVAHGTPCLGPVTHAGCGALCPRYDRGCYGCFGPKETPNTASLAELVRRARLHRTASCTASSARSTRRRASSEQESEAHERSPLTVRGRARSARTTLARVEGEGAHVRAASADGARALTSSCASTSRRASSRRSCAAATSREAPDITARICGICPVAYQMSAVPRDRGRLRRRRSTAALRDAAPAALLRRVDREPRAARATCCTRPTSSATRAAIAMARDHPEIVQARPAAEEGRQRTGRAGRRPRDPSDQRARRRLLPRADASASCARSQSELERGREIRARHGALGRRVRRSRTSSRTTSSSRCASRASTRSNEGRIVSSAGLDIAAAEYDEHFVEEHVAHSNALHSGCASASAYLRRSAGALHAQRRPALARGPRRRRRGGPDGRRAATRSAASSCACVEIVYACDEALRLIERLRAARATGGRGRAPRPAIGYGCTEAPRGMLYHRYEIDADGIDPRRHDRAADLAEPARSIERDLRAFVEQPPRPAGRRSCTLACEQAIRNYDPCISCATHFLRLEVDRV